MCSEDETDNQASRSYDAHIRTVEKLIVNGLSVPAHILSLKPSTLAMEQLRKAQEQPVKMGCLIHSIPRYRLNTDKLIP